MVCFAPNLTPFSVCFREINSLYGSCSKNNKKLFSQASFKN